MRLIDADALKGMDIKIGHIGEKTVRAIQWATVDAFYRNIDKSPTIDAVPVVRGEWIRTQYEFNRYGTKSVCVTDTCSLCRGEFEWLIDAKHCPNCGAKMDGGDT